MSKYTICVFGRAYQWYMYLWAIKVPFQRKPCKSLSHLAESTTLSQIFGQAATRQVSSYDRLWSDLLSKFRACASVWCHICPLWDALWPWWQNGWDFRLLSGASFGRSTISPCPNGVGLEVLLPKTVLLGSWDGYITPVQNLDPPQSFLLRICPYVVLGYITQTKAWRLVKTNANHCVIWAILRIFMGALFWVTISNLNFYKSKTGYVV